MTLIKRNIDIIIPGKWTEEQLIEMRNRKDYF